MGIQTLTVDDIIISTKDIVKDCIKYKAGPYKVIDINNAINSARMNAMIFKRNPELYWKLKSTKLYNSHNDSQTYIDTYNKEAHILGIPEYHITFDHLIGLFVMLYFMFSI